MEIIKNEKKNNEISLINLILSLSSGIAVFQFINDIFDRTAKKGGLFTKTGSFIIAFVGGLEVANKINNKLKGVMLWEKLISLA